MTSEIDVAVTLMIRLFFIHVEELGLEEQVAVVVGDDAGLDEERHRLEVVELGVVLQRRDDHVVEREQREDDVRHEVGVAEQRRPDLRRSRLRTPTTMLTPSGCSGAGRRRRPPAAGTGRARSAAPCPRLPPVSPIWYASVAKRCVRVDGPAARQHLDDVEVGEREDRREQDDDGEDRLEQRQRDVVEAAPRAGAVHLGRLVVLARDRDEPGEHDDREERQPAPHVDRDDRRHRVAAPCRASWARAG